MENGGRHHKLRILLVEDSPTDAAIVEMALARWPHPHELTWVTRLSDGVAVAGQTDVVLLDLNLPDSSGPESIAALSCEFAEVPVVMLTGVNDAATTLKAIHAGAQDYLVKGSFDRALLARTLLRALERFDMRRALYRGGPGAGRERTSAPPPGMPPPSTAVVNLSDGRELGRVIDVAANVSALHTVLARPGEVLHVHVDAEALVVGEGLPAVPGREHVLIVAEGAHAVSTLERARASVREAGLRFGLGAGWTLETVVLLEPDVVVVDARWTRGLAVSAARRRALRRLVRAITSLGVEPIATGFAEDDGEHLAASAIAIGFR